MGDDEFTLLHLRRDYGKDKMVAYIIRRFRELKVELGKTNAEIDHLNEEIKKRDVAKTINDELSKEVRKNIKKEEMYESYRKQIKDLEKSLEKAKRDNQYLIYQLNQKKKA